MDFKMILILFLFEGQYQGISKGIEWFSFSPSISGIDCKSVVLSFKV